MPSEITGPLQIAALVARTFEELGIVYCLGGSLASSLYGEPRSTNDIDFACALQTKQVGRFAAALGEDFVVDESSLSEAIAQAGSYNIFYLPFLFKIDLFIPGRSPFDVEQFARRRRLHAYPGGPELFVASPEDCILRKLDWWRAGGGVSNQQWRDVIQMLRVSRAVLENDYLDRWAGELQLERELSRARRDAESGQ